MIHSHIHHPAFRGEHEARLCRMADFERSPQHAHEAVSSYQEMRDSPNLVAARAQFDNPDMRRLYPEMEGKRPLDRAFFTALMLSSTLPDGKTDYRDLDRADMTITDPFGLGAMEDQELGEWLDKNVQPELIKKIDKTPKPTTQPELDVWYGRIGIAYKDRMGNANKEWKRSGKLDDVVVARVPLERYRTIRKDVDTIFAKAAIRVPGIDADKTDLGDNSLTRREYLTILSFVWKDTTGTFLETLTEEANRGGVEGVRDLVKNTATAPSAVDRVYVDLSLEELGPSETINNLGITIPVDLSANYTKALTGKNPDQSIVVDTTEGMFEEPVDGMKIKPEDSAAVWGTHPERAYPFLSEYMAVPNEANTDFLYALEYHFVLSPSEHTGREEPNMSIEDTRAMVTLIGQMLLESQNVKDNTSAELVDYRDRLTLADKIENGAADVFEYMKDMRSHPIGSTAAWLVAIGGLVATYRFLKKEHRNFTWIAGGAALVGVAAGLYQQNRTGEAWWETVWNKASTFMGRERTKEPTKQTLPNYWAEQLTMDSDRERVMLSLMSQGKVGPMMDWYGQMREWEQRGSPMEESQPELPLDIDPAFDKYFGQVSWDERGKQFYKVMGTFLANRGRAMKAEYPDYTSALKLEDDEAIGYAYMKDRYVNQTYFASLVSGIEKIRDFKINGRVITEWDDSEPELRKIKETRPDIYATLVEIRQKYVQETKTRRSADWDMATIFLLEAKPETLRRMGRDGVEAASYIDTIYSSVKKTLEAPFLNGPDDLAAKETLFRGDEALLVAETAEMFRDRNGTELMPDDFNERVVADWTSFLGRLPVDNAAQEKLALFMPKFLAENEARPQIEKLNEIERIKYQLLVLAAQNDSRLSTDVLDKLDPENSTTWNVLLDQTLDWVWFDEAAFPKMDDLNGLQSLFGSEAYQVGGVDWYNVIARAFPRWKESEFKILRAQITDYQNALLRLRLFPILELGKAPLEKEDIDAIEMQLARHMANRTLEALLLTHGNGNTPDRKIKRTVSPVEQKNLLDYNDALFVKLLGKTPQEIQPGVVLPTTLENINNYIWNKLPGDVMYAVDKSTGAIKYYVLDPTGKFWVETGLPWITQKLDEADIILGAGLVWSAEQLNALWTNVSPILARFPGEFVKVSGAAGAATLEWFDTTGKSIGTVAYAGYEQMQRAIYEVHGVPEDKFEDFKAKEQLVEMHEVNGKNAKLKVSIIGTSDVVIGQFNGFPDYSTYLNPKDIPYLGPQLPSQFDTTNFMKDGTFITVKVADFLARTPEDLMKEWRDKAFAEKKALFEAATNPKLKVNVSANPEIVEYDDATVLVPRAQSSIYEFISKTDTQIEAAFNAWMNKPAKAATDIDPLA